MKAFTLLCWNTADKQRDAFTKPKKQRNSKTDSLNGLCQIIEKERMAQKEGLDNVNKVQMIENHAGSKQEGAHTPYKKLS